MKPFPPGRARRDATLRVRMPFRSFLALSLACGLISACGQVQLPDLASYLPGGARPAMRWDERPEAASWTARAMRAVGRHDDALAGHVPADIDTFCPRYRTAALADRRAFWVGLVSATSKHESSYNPRASGGGGRYIGLMQISPGTARQAGCEARTTAALKDGAANLECAVEIFAPHVAQDGMVAGSGNRGVARDWGPFSRKSKRAEIAAWTAKQAYCQAPTRLATR